MLSDHLGSVDTITDASGAVTERMSFDAWGKRREVAWYPLTDPTTYQSATTTRGFTGPPNCGVPQFVVHDGEVGNTRLREQLDPVGLVHMKG